MKEEEHVTPCKMALLLLGMLAMLQTTTWAQETLMALPADARATKQTSALFENLRVLAGNHILFGHQDDLAYGVTWRRDARRSDVKDVCGVYPAVFGWELGKLAKGAAYNIDSVSFEDMKQWIREAYKMGGVNTISWHLDNIKTGGSAWDTTTAVRDLLPGGPLHQKLLHELDLMADFLGSLKSGGVFSHPVPIIFRPWHENTGWWFWWGNKSCTPDEYKNLWRFTVHYLRDIKKLHNLLYAFSPSNFMTEEQYLETYPGDDYVDVLGFDYYYYPNNLKSTREDLERQIGIIAKLAGERKKVAAITETGYESIPDAIWWTNSLLPDISPATTTSGISYVMVWRNSRSNHHYAPYPGHQSAANFVWFSRNQRMMFQDTLPNLYKNKKQTANNAK